VPIRVYDYRTDIANLIVFPEIRGRFMRMDPAPAGRMHSHDLGGEIFLVLEGQCEFLVEDERMTCGPGQLIYVEPLLKHTLHAVGDVSNRRIPNTMRTIGNCPRATGRGAVRSTATRTPR